MRRHTPILFLVFWIFVVLLAIQPITEAACLPPLEHQFYMPLMGGGASSAPAENQVGVFSIVQPEATINLAKNPSFENNTTDWTGVSASLAIATDYQRFGLYSLEVNPGSGTNSDGVYTAFDGEASGVDYTATAWFHGPVGIGYKIYFANSSGTLIGTATQFTATGEWQKVEVHYTETGFNSRRLYITKDNNSSSALFYIDGVQIEAKAYSTTYCDGSLPGCEWVGKVHNSNSYRTLDQRDGGKEVDLETLGAYLISQQGTGMPQVTNLSTLYAGIDGGKFQKTRVGPRTFTFALSIAGDGAEGWHQRRKLIENLIKPDATYPPQPFTLKYSGGGETLAIQCVYDGGMEIADGKRDIEAIPIRCIAHDPYWYKDNYNVQQLATNINVGTTGTLIHIDPDYRDIDDLSQGMNDEVQRIVVSNDRSNIYFGGAFTSAGGSSTNRKGIVRYAVDSVTGGQYQTMGTGLHKSVGDVVVSAMVVAPNGDLYIAGLFDDAGGVANTENIAKWDGSAWSALGTGLTGGTLGVLSLVFGPDGKLYAGGDFDDAGGTACHGTAVWDGTSWDKVGDGTNGSIAAMAFVGRRLYIGGSFNAVNYVSTGASNFGWWDIDTSTVWTAPEGVSGGGINTMFTDRQGTLWVGGSWTTAGGALNNGVASYNGTSWTPYGSFGSGSYVKQFLYDGQDRLMAVGHFPTLNGYATQDTLYTSWTAATFAGTTWLPYPVRHQQGSINAAAFHPSIGLIFSSPLTFQFVSVGGATTVTNNGSTRAYPKLVIIGAEGTSPSDDDALYYIGNLRTNKWIYFTDLKLQVGEHLTLDLTPGSRSFISDFKGDILNKISPGSNLSEFMLMPGENEIVLFAEQPGDPDSGIATSQFFLTWEDKCWSVDSSGDT